MNVNISINADIKKERDRFVAFAFASADILIELDEKNEIIFANGAVFGVFGIKSEQLYRKNLLSIIADNDKEKIFHALKILPNIGRIDRISTYILRDNGEEIPVYLSGFSLNSKIYENMKYLTISVIRDEATREEIFRRDIYSGLLKKEDFALDAVNKITESTEEDLKLTFLDISNIKEMLDDLPIDYATSLMAEIYEYIRLKSIDGDLAGIVDDESYSLVHSDNISADEIAKSIKEITKKIDGIGADAKIFSVETEGIEKLTAKDSANTLLYVMNKFAAEKGENFCINSLAESYDSMLEDAVMQIDNFRKLIEKEKFEMAFQPIVNIKDGVAHHYEVLVRLPENSNFDNPFHFITFGEESGVIGEFDLVMADKSLEILEKESTDRHKPSVAINLSGKSLSSNLFMDSFKKLLDKHSTVKKQLIVEITESAKITDIKLANNFIQELRAEKILCCLDDFGSGESSFDYLRNFQVDYVKIDGSYVKESMATAHGRAMLKAMANLCRNLKVTAIGEMVEDERSAKFLWDCGVQFGQGYLFGKPDTNVKVLENCMKSNPNYQGIMRARKVSEAEKKWWSSN